MQKQDTVLREAIPASMKLAATIRFLSTGSNYADLQHLFRIHKSTLSKFIPEVCEALYKQLKDNHLKVWYIFLYKWYNMCATVCQNMMHQFRYCCCCNFVISLAQNLNKSCPSDVGWYVADEMWVATVPLDLVLY